MVSIVADVVDSFVRASGHFRSNSCQLQFQSLTKRLGDLVLGLQDSPFDPVEKDVYLEKLQVTFPVGAVAPHQS